MKLKLYIIALLALFVASCTREVLPDPVDQGEKIVTISAIIPAETKVSYDDGTRKLAWETGDQLLLVGFDNSDAYVGNSTFNYQSGNTFSGIPVPSAVKYQAYYKVAGINLNETTGEVTTAATFYDGQTQSGSGSTAHLKSKLFLGDDTAKPLTQSFTLSGKSSILKLALSGIPQEVGMLQQLIYTVETASGVFKSVPLNVTGVTFSAALDNITAFIAFDPAVVTNIDANGKVRITLFGEQPYEWSATSASGKNYIAGNRYTGTVSGGWTQKVLINPLSYVAEYNVTQAGDAFVTSLTACNVSGYFLFQDAVDNFITKTIGGVDYHLPSSGEWFGIAPEFYNAQVSVIYVLFNSTSSYDNVSETVVVQGETITMTSDFRSTGISDTLAPCYALRYRGTDMVSAWKYEVVDYDTNTCHMKITSRNVSPSVTIDDIANAEYWISGTANDVIRYFPASGFYYKSSQPSYVGRVGFFWSSTAIGANGWCLYFSNGFACTRWLGQSHVSSVRLFVTPN
ncbi:MAG: hypothetical protein GX971_04450 [Firmicutes bacterium]|nr:hypothetical protein [Bacillota bacterium]